MKAVAKTATIMITLKNFNLFRLLSQQVASVCLGRELQGSNVFLIFFGCVSHAGSALQRGGLTALFFNDYWCVVIHEFEQLNDVRVAHPNAATAGRAANLALVFCAMDVNEALTRVSIVLVQSVQP
jgi:hypothetical protein